MPKYTIELTRKAQKQLDKLPDQVALTILEAIKKLEDDPRPNGCKKLKGRTGYRIRSGSYRVLYEVFDNVLLIDVFAIGNRRDIY